MQYSSFSTCNILAIPIKNYSNAIFFVVQFQQRIIPQRNILYTIPTTNYFIIQYSLCNSNNELFHNEIISAQFHQRIIPMQYFSCNSNNKLFRSEIFFMQFHQWIILQCNIFHSAIPTKNYFTTKYSLCNSINELSHSAIFFVQFQQRIIPRCNMHRQSIRQQQLYVRYNRSNIPQWNIFRAKPLMKYSAVQYPPCKITMQMLTMRCHCRDIPRRNINSANVANEIFRA